MKLDEKIDSLAIGIKKYTSTNYELIRLEALESSSVMSANIIGMLTVGLFAVFFLLFASLLLLFFLSSVLDNIYYGLSIVVGLYLFMGILVYFNKKKWIETPICNSIIKTRMEHQMNNDN